jgi:hypothetical protein
MVDCLYLSKRKSYSVRSVLCELNVCYCIRTTTYLGLAMISRIVYTDLIVKVVVHYVRVEPIMVFISFVLLERNAILCIY